VLLDKSIELLAPHPGGTYADATVGAGGHSLRICALSQNNGKLIGIDRDPNALAVARRRLERFGDRVSLVHGNFAELPDILAAHGIDRVDGVLFDLGLSSIQVDDANRGFSFRYGEAELDMRADPTTGPTAAELIARLPEPELADLLWRLADEHRSRRIAKAICRERRREPVRTAGRLAEIVERAVGGRRGRVHPATKTFLALRFAVNAELDNLNAALAALPAALNPGARAVLISFCSSEDRLVKRAFRSGGRDGIWEVLTRKPVVPDEAERRENPRARSAKLRAVERTEKSVESESESKPQHMRHRELMFWNHGRPS
jgi:16S rRNA (cytosine1402-N4)-methyltransferase